MLSPTGFLGATMQVPQDLKRGNYADAALNALYATGVGAPLVKGLKHSIKFANNTRTRTLDHVNRIQRALDDVNRIERNIEGLNSGNPVVGNPVVGNINKINNKVIREIGKLRYDIKRGSFHPKSLYNMFQDNLPGDQIGFHQMFGSADYGFKQSMIKAASLPKGRRFAESSLSSDSYPLLLANLRRQGDRVKVKHTGEFNMLNPFGKMTNNNNTINKQLEILRAHEDKAIKDGLNIPYSKIIDGRIHVPYIIAEKRGATLLDNIKRHKKIGTIGSALGLITAAELAMSTNKPREQQYKNQLSFKKEIENNLKKRIDQ